MKRIFAALVIAVALVAAFGVKPLGDSWSHVVAGDSWSGHHNYVAGDSWSRVKPNGDSWSVRVK